MTKIGRYSGFILGFTNIIANETYYKSHFHDDYTPVLVFVTRTAARCATIAKLAGTGKLLLGHYSSRYKELNGFLEEAQRVFANSLLSVEGESIVLEDE